MYRLIRWLLFRMEPEKAHAFTLMWLKRLNCLGLLKSKVTDDPVTLMGLRFKNRIGLAAGLDKNGEYIDALAALGFGFIEIGTVTPRPQPGKPQPRLFRLPKAEAVINRMGFNNKGVDYLIEQVKQARYQGVLGINIGKNADTPLELAYQDYCVGLEKVYLYASYITVNLSSPNTEGLRDLQHGDFLRQLLAQIKACKQRCAEQHHRIVPILVKLSPDLSEAEFTETVELILAHGIDGIIATNTTVDREAVAGLEYAQEAGGLSGRPLQQKSTDVIRQLRALVPEHYPIIGVGGIIDAASAQDKLMAGADLLQVYTGLVYQGPGVLKLLSI